MTNIFYIYESIKFEDKILSHADFMRTTTGIICGLQSYNTYVDDKKKGVNPNVATANLCGNLLNGLARNEIAYDMARFGNPMGNFINMYAGYGNPTSNAIGTIGLMSACTPWMFFNTPCCYYGGFGMMGMSYGMMPYQGMGWGMGGFWC